MSDDDYRVGYKRPPRHTQFPPGTSGNPTGRPPAPRRALTPSQLRKDVLEVMDEVVELKTPSGVKKLTMMQLIIRAAANKAAKGNAACMKVCLELLRTGLQERFDTYATVRLIDMLQKAVEDPRFEINKETLALLDAHIRATKRVY